MRSILRSILAGYGVRQIFEAADGADGLEIAVERVPDVILLDWSMSPVSGADFLRILRADRDMILNTTPVLVISAHCQRATVAEALQRGIHGFIAKPVSPVMLYRHVVDMLLRQERFGRTKGLAAKASAKKEKTRITPLQRVAQRSIQGEAPPENDPSMLALL